MDVVLAGAGGSRLGDLMRSYLIYDMLWRGNSQEQREGLGLFFESIPTVPVRVPDDGLVAGTCALFVGDAVREYTFQYDLKSDAALATWWQANGPNDRDSWARAKVDAIVGKKGEITEEERHILFMVTRNLVAAQPGRLNEFREWWSRNRERPRATWIASLVEQAIPGVAAATLEARRDAQMQLDSVFSFYEFLDILSRDFVMSLPDNWEQDADALKRIEQEWQSWWAKNQNRFSCGPYPGTADEVWLLVNGKVTKPKGG